MLTHKEAEDRMLYHIIRNLALEEFTRQGPNFYFRQRGNEYALKTTTHAIRPASLLIDEIKEDAKKEVATAVLCLRSTGNYDGDLLKQDRGWKSNKKTKKFERDLADLFGNQVAYFNPDSRLIQIISFRRYFEIPLQAQELKDSEDPRERQVYHEWQGICESKRRISVRQNIKGGFRLEQYVRQTRPLVARFVPCDIQRKLF